MRRKAALTLLLTSFLVLPVAASADGPAFGSGAGVVAEDDGGYLGSGHNSAQSADSGYFGSGHESAKSADGGYYGSGHKDGGTIVTSGGVRAQTVALLRTWLRLSPRFWM